MGYGVQNAVTFDYFRIYLQGLKRGFCQVSDRKRAYTEVYEKIKSKSPLVHGHIKPLQDISISYLSKLNVLIS